jgi:hypothetical protein
MEPSSLKTIGAIVTIAIALSLGFVSYQINGNAKPSDDTASHGIGALSPTYDLDRLGRDATLSEVKTSAGLSQPTYLPSGTSPPQIKLKENTSLAVLIYTNPNLKRIIGYEQDVQIVILAEKDGSSFEDFLKVNEPTVTVTMTKDGREEVRTVDVPATRQTLSRASEVSISGNPGYGYDPSATAERQGGSGRVQWWSEDGIHYQILANLPLQELVRIAESMPST